MYSLRPDLAAVDSIAAPADAVDAACLVPTTHGVAATWLPLTLIINMIIALLMVIASAVLINSGNLEGLEMWIRLQKSYDGRNKT